MSLRGEVLPLFGLSEVLGLSAKTTGDKVLVVKAGHRGAVAGLCVDELGEIRERVAGPGLPLPATLAEHTRAFLVDVQPGPPPFALLDVRAILEGLAKQVSATPGRD
jgi:chemotaxis signal transduction protein